MSFEPVYNFGRSVGQAVYFQKMANTPSNSKKSISKIILSSPTISSAIAQQLAFDKLMFNPKTQPQAKALASNPFNWEKTRPLQENEFYDPDRAANNYVNLMTVLVTTEVLMQKGIVKASAAANTAAAETTTVVAKSAIATTGATSAASTSASPASVADSVNK